MSAASRAAVIVLLVGGLLGAPSCGGDAGQLVVYLTGSPNVAEDPLDPAVVRWLRVRVEGPDMGVVTVEGPFERGESTRLPPVPAGPRRRIVVEGLTGAEGLLVSRGESLPFDISVGHHEIELFVGLVERFSAIAGDGLEPPRHGAAVVVDGDGTVLVTGGAAGPDAAAPSGALGRVERFDPTSARLVAPLECAGDPDCAIAARWDHVAVNTASGVLLLGGVDDAGPVEGLGRCLLGTCVETARIPLHRERGVVATQPGGGAWVLGGLDAFGFSRRVDHVDATGGLLAGAGDLPFPGPGLAAAVDETGSLLTLGHADRRPRLGRRTGPAMTFTVLEDLDDRQHAALVDLEDGRILILGGQSQDGEGLASIALYDGSDESVCEIGALLRPRWRHAATRLKDGRVLVTGGLIATGLASAEAEILDPRYLPGGGSCERVAGRLEVRSAPRMLHTRSDHAVVALANGAALVVGGLDDRGRALGAMELFVPGR